ncbi:dTDP-4-dehydrorhamnose reductase [Leadbetterella byssophila DSM 17132]|uniref:dTDP-4-dehydrorhamnose reductase n=1 Tax=Leadbetterella byssophila (strain DSM 17132 / JCM 16389 / KACC 11308 / NBRC 106382 / 4M15) TaxID=649349 RepID=E4RQ19_LEAB4|nr:NAD(P)-dependent oxidoreductase [Leadbetterella byssophila]ADQ16502.1 dTDP-4-dehydrorhamnose reductase [Leadbetterella byssophila DSM 17132]
MKILITGSNGLLGQKLVQQLAGKGDIIATARGENRLPLSDGYRYRSLDITDPEAVNAVIIEETPDAIIHTAAMTNVDQCETDKEECWKLNVHATEYLVKAAEKTGSYFLHVSTDFIFDGKEGPYAEDAEPNPISFYGWSKFAAEKVVQSSSLNWSIARTVLVYGIAHDMSRSNIILWVKGSLEAGKTIKVVNDQWRTPTLAEDLAAGCILMVEKKAQGIYNISGKDLLNPYQMAVMTADYFGLDKNLIQEVNGTQFTQTARRPPKTGFILDKPIKDLGYSPRSFTEGIGILASQLK